MCSLRLFVYLSVLVSFSVTADIPQDAQQAEQNANRVTLLKLMAQQAEARGDYLTCAALAKEADRIATMTDILKQQVLAQYAQLNPAQQQQVRAAKERVIADATAARADADSISGCLKKVQAAAALLILFLVVVFGWLFWRAFGPFRLENG